MQLRKCGLVWHVWMLLLLIHGTACHKLCADLPRSQIFVTNRLPVNVQLFLHQCLDHPIISATCSRCVATVSKFWLSDSCSHFGSVSSPRVPLWIFQTNWTYMYVTHIISVNGFEHFMCFCRGFPEFEEKFNVRLLLYEEKEKHNLRAVQLRRNWLTQDFLFTNPWPRNMRQLKSA
jgi:hypothetical protein